MVMMSDSQFGNLRTMTVCKNIVNKKLKIRITSRNVEAESRIKSAEFHQQMFMNDEYSHNVSENGSKKPVMNKSHKFVLHYSDESNFHDATTKVKLPMRPSNKREPPGMVDSHKGKRQKMDRSVKQQCSSILKTLMTHPAGWVFIEPVDPVALNIPDYFSIISEPMDLGTIKTKLEEYMYFTVEEFASDVRLTFSNAMLYNPPSNNVHVMAKELENIFTSRWKSLQGKVNCESGNVEGFIITGRAKNSQDTKQLSHKKSLMCVPEISLSCEQKRKLKKEIVQASSGKMTEKLRSFLQKFGLICVKEEELEMNIDALGSEMLRELKRLIKDSLDARDVKVDNVKMTENGRRQFSGKVVHKGTVSGNRSACGFANTKPSLSLAAPKCGSCGYVECQCSLRKDHAYGSTSDLSSERSARQGQCASKKDHEEKNISTCRVDNSGSDGATSSLDEEIICSTPQHSMPVTTAASGEGSGPVIDVPLSPNKALRAAMLKSRFADTIFKAKQKTLLDNGNKADLVRIQQEKERLERQQQEEKLRIEAQIRAAEAASKLKAEKELKIQREREREAARITLQKMEKTAEIDDNLEVLKDLEMLRGSVFEAIEAGHLGNPLERLGLFIKDDYLGGDDDDEAEDDDEKDIWSGDGEEGEIFV
ncbi:hypothetical protein LguiA_025028 [Lonicera macranthoides]